MKTKISIVLSIVGLGLASALHAQDQPPPNLVAETWACSYKEGQDWSDKAKARDYMVNQIDKAGLTKTPAYHWELRKGMAPVDTVWFDIHPDFASFAAASDAWDASGIGAGVDTQFDKVEDCTAGLSVIRPFHAREGGMSDESLVVNLACTFNHGRSGDDMPDLARHMGGVMNTFGDDAPSFAAMRQPITRGANYPDGFIFYVFDDMTHWSRYGAQLFGTDAGERMRNHLDMLVDCNLSLWDAQQVVTPDSE